MSLSWMLSQSNERDAALGDSRNGSGATIYRASLIARVGKVSTAGSHPDS